MNRLKVGDECYVRGKFGEIYKCEVISTHRRAALVQAINNDDHFRFFTIGKNLPSRLVYPFPCVKEKAV